MRPEMAKVSFPNQKKIESGKKKIFDLQALLIKEYKQLNILSARQPTCNKAVGNSFHISCHWLYLCSDYLSFFKRILRPVNIRTIPITIFILNFASVRNNGFRGSLVQLFEKVYNEKVEFQKAECLVRALVSKNAILFFFTISKSNFIAYTIPFYNSTHIKKFYFY